MGEGFKKFEKKGETWDVHLGEQVREEAGVCSMALVNMKGLLEGRNLKFKVRLEFFVFTYIILKGTGYGREFDLTWIVAFPGEYEKAKEKRDSYRCLQGS